MAWTSREQSLQLLANAERDKQLALRESRWLVLTLGTAQAFTLASNGQVVSNCHRLPNALFGRRLLTVDECLEALLPRLTQWLDADPSRQVLLTVSPVRYLRDGAVNNSRGKAVLHLVCQELESRLKRLSYFPAYEIVCDELRSYRFFESDLVHPNSLAVDLVWRRFLASYFRNEDLPTLALMEKIQRSLEHRWGPHSEPQALARKGLQRLQRLRELAPAVDLAPWEERFRTMLRSAIKG